MGKLLPTVVQTLSNSCSGETFRQLLDNLSGGTFAASLSGVTFRAGSWEPTLANISPGSTFPDFPARVFPGWACRQSRGGGRLSCAELWQHPAQRAGFAANFGGEGPPRGTAQVRPSRLTAAASVARRPFPSCASDVVVEDQSPARREEQVGTGFGGSAGPGAPNEEKTGRERSRRVCEVRTIGGDDAMVRDREELGQTHEFHAGLACWECGELHATAFSHMPWQSFVEHQHALEETARQAQAVMWGGGGRRTSTLPMSRALTLFLWKYARRR